MNLAIENNPTTQPASGSHAIGGKFLSFFLSNEEYGFEIQKVQEIICLLPVTPVPRTPEFILGVINLRGKVIPVTDLRTKFAMPPAKPTAETCIIVVRVGSLEMGIVVDKVSEVMEIAPTNIEAVPHFGVAINTDFILGLGKYQNKVKILLDIDKVLSTDAPASVEFAAVN